MEYHVWFYRCGLLNILLYLWKKVRLNKNIMRNHRHSVVCWLLLCLLSIFCGGVYALPVGDAAASAATRGWLKYYDQPMTYTISKDVAESKGYSDSSGRVLYYAVNLAPHGFIILSADDELEPVIAFSVSGRYQKREGDPLCVLLEQDMNERLNYAAVKKTSKVKSGISNNAGKWQTLIAAGDQTKSEVGVLGGVDTLSDVRVEPFVESLWGQGNAYNDYCYNYYTPNHYVTGCVATAMAQLMRYHNWPQSGIGVKAFQISVDGEYQNWNTRGGDGSGGAYNWSEMLHVPNRDMTTSHRQAIGALCYDSGLSVGMNYTANNSSSSSKRGSDALELTFGYENSIYGQGFTSSADSGLWTMMNTNLDARLPVILSISGSAGGHAVVADGYGYNGETMYHHINMGWGGTDNTWYALPLIDSSYTFDVINGCVYNVFPSNTGEIVSGRVLSMAGSVIENALVTAYNGNTILTEVTTDENGIYALKYMPSNTAITISATKDGYVFADKNVTTGRSQVWRSTSGNKWAVNFEANNAMPPTAISDQITVHCLESKIITLGYLDDHLPDPPGAVSCIITSLPVHGTINVPGDSEISFVPFVLPGNTVEYVPCDYYGGPDSFTFKANDGGTAPTGGDSDIAVIDINVDNTLSADFGLDGTFNTNGAIDSTYYASKSQCIYLASDIGEAKNITDMAMSFSFVPPITLSNWTIRMQHTELDAFNSVSDDFQTTGWTEVYRGDLAATENGWLNFHFDTPFLFDGSRNLLIEFSFDNSVVSDDTGWYLCEDLDCGCTRMVTIKSDSATHADPRTWDFSDGGGSYWPSDWLPSIQLVGEVLTESLAGDFNYSCDVNLPDMAIIAEAWQSQVGQGSYNPACDISDPQDEKIDMLDLQVFAESWLSSN